MSLIEKLHDKKLAESEAGDGTQWLVDRRITCEALGLLLSPSHQKEKSIESSSGFQGGCFYHHSNYCYCASLVEGEFRSLSGRQ
jgi:hypothetical protein